MRHLLLPMLCLTLLGCAHKTRLIANDNAIIVEGLFSVWGSWVKDKGHKLDVRLHVANDAPHDIVLRPRDLHCSKGERWGNLRLLNVPRRASAIRILPGQVVEIVAVCVLRGPTPGDLRVLFARVFEGHRPPWRGREPTGEVLATDVEWVVHQEHLRD